MDAQESTKLELEEEAVCHVPDLHVHHGRLYGLQYLHAIHSWSHGTIRGKRSARIDGTFNVRACLRIGSNAVLAIIRATSDRTQSSVLDHICYIRDSARADSPR